MDRRYPVCSCVPKIGRDEIRLPMGKEREVERRILIEEMSSGCRESSTCWSMNS